VVYRSPFEPNTPVSGPQVPRVICQKFRNNVPVRAQRRTGASSFASCTHPSDEDRVCCFPWLGVAGAGVFIPVCGAQVTAKMLQACYDPQEMDSFMANSLTPDELSKFTFNEFTYRVMSILTKQI
jgi:hypothetical protein